MPVVDAVEDVHVGGVPGHEVPPAMELEQGCQGGREPGAEHLHLVTKENVNVPDDESQKFEQHPSQVELQAGFGVLPVGQVEVLQDHENH